MKNYILKFILFLVIGSIFSSCKLKSLVSSDEFSSQDNLEQINATYLLPEEDRDSLHKYGRFSTAFAVRDLIKEKDKKQFSDKDFERLSVVYNGKDKITFNLSDGNDALSVTYKCKRKDDFLEIYFKKTRIWALPLFMKYEYDRLRIGLDEDSNLIVHKWKTLLATLTIVPFDYFGHKDYSQKLSRISE